LSVDALAVGRVQTAGVQQARTIAILPGEVNKNKDSGGVLCRIGCPALCFLYSSTRESPSFAGGRRRVAAAGGLFRKSMETTHMGEQPGTTEAHSGEGWLSREQRHAFKNIFSIILANAEMLGEDLDNTGQVRRRLERIVAASRRGEQLVAQIGNAAPLPPALNAEQTATAPESVRSVGQVLVVDDEPDVVEIIQRYLERDGLKVQGCVNSREALEQVQAHPLRFDLVITDFDMPHLSGLALCDQLHGLRPDLPIVMVTGYDRRTSGERIADLGVRAVLPKPINKNDLLNTVRRLLPA
jgi:CheY-like chemotaxis protein